MDRQISELWLERCEHQHETKATNKQTNGWTRRPFVKNSVDVRNLYLLYANNYWSVDGHFRFLWPQLDFYCDHQFLLSLVSSRNVLQLSVSFLVFKTSFLMLLALILEWCLCRSQRLDIVIHLSKLSLISTDCLFRFSFNVIYVYL